MMVTHPMRAPLNENRETHGKQCLEGRRWRKRGWQVLHACGYSTGLIKACNNPLLGRDTLKHADNRVVPGTGEEG